MPINLVKSIRNSLFFLFLIFVFLYIFAESNYIQNKNILFINGSLSELILSSLGLLFVLWTLPTKSRYNWLKFSQIILKSLLIFTVLFVVFAEAAMVDFSGMLFGPEAIVHFSLDAVILGINEYFWLFCLLLLFMTVAVIMLVYSNQILLSKKAQWLVFMPSILLLTYFFDHTVLGRYYEGVRQYIELNQIQVVNEKEIRKLEPIGMTPLAVNKLEITANSAIKKNLVVIYLESFSEIFTTSSQYPSLTPNINRLKSQYTSLSPYLSTAKFTMDGLIGSLCGFIPNMTLGNNALTDSEKYYYLVPCMTDVLKKAGYHQEFIGGAKKSFANKDTFLLDHGYDQVWGSEDFDGHDAHHVSQKRNWWGLHDNDLFDFAAYRINLLKNKNKPFHISLLSLATHLNGFPAPTCQPYNSQADPFINAIHCTDQLVGQFIDQLETNGMLDNTVVFITGDHSVFSTSLTKGLFGESISNKNILGIIIDKNATNKNIPMALYDMAPVLLDRLEINHNVTFINGRSNTFSSDRLLISRRQVHKNGLAIQLDTSCEDSDELTADNLNLCTHRNAIKTLHGYSQTFRLGATLKYQAGSSLNVIYNEDKTSISEIKLNSKSIKDLFTRDGFKLNENNYSSADIFYVQFDPNKKSITKTFLLNSFKDPINIIHYLNGQADLPFIVFGVKDALTDFFQDLSQFDSFSCPNDEYCLYKIDQLGDVKQNTELAEMALIFKH